MNQGMVCIYKHIAFLKQQKRIILIVTASITKISLTCLLILNIQKVPAANGIAQQMKHKKKESILILK